MFETTIDTAKVNMISSTDVENKLIIHQYLNKSISECPEDDTPDVFWHIHRYSKVEPVIEYWGKISTHWRQHSAVKPFLGLWAHHDEPQLTPRKKSIHVFDDLRFGVDIELALEFINASLRHDKRATVIIVTNRSSRLGSNFDRRVKEVLGGHINDIDKVNVEYKQSL